MNDGEFPQGLKPLIGAELNARLKPCPDLDIDISAGWFVEPKPEKNGAKKLVPYGRGRSPMPVQTIA